MPTRSTRANAAAKSGKTASSSAKPKSISKSKYFGKKKAGTKATKESEDDELITEEELEDEGDEAFEEDASEAESLDSDALDDEDDFEDSGKGVKKRKRVVSSPRKATAKKTKTGRATKKKSAASPRKRRKTAKGDEDEEEESDFELQEGQEIVGVVVQAPKTGRVPPGQISKNTFDFLSQLQKPECNDREWFKLREPVYRLAESEWKAFVETFTDLLVEVDPQIPHLPPKDVIHRIYRDVRFSNDKTPYKTCFSATFSRSGRKGIFASFSPGGGSMFAAGSWCPGRNELATIRSNLQRSSRRFRQIISAPEFEALFGPARPHPKGAHQNVFGMEDELKVAPKGVDKMHKDIDLLKCRSYAVMYKFTDKQALSPEFKDELANVAKVVRPFVHCLNDLMTIQDGDSSGSEDEGDEDDNNGTESS